KHPRQGALQLRSQRGAPRRGARRCRSRRPTGASDHGRRYALCVGPGLSRGRRSPPARRPGDLPAGAVRGSDGTGALRDRGRSLPLPGFCAEEGRPAPPILRRGPQWGRGHLFLRSPHRLASTLGIAVEVLGAERAAAVCRELTKTFEEVKAGTLAELAEWAAEIGRASCRGRVEGTGGTVAEQERK